MQSEMDPSSMAPILPTHREKSDKFISTDSKYWQQWMLCYLTMLNLARFLREDAPTISQDETNKEKRATYDTWGHNDFLCQK